MFPECVRGAVAETCREFLELWEECGSKRSTVYARVGGCTHLKICHNDAEAFDAFLQLRLEYPSCEIFILPR